MNYLRQLHQQAKQDSAFERYMQDTVHNWREGMTRWEKVRQWSFRFYLCSLLHMLWVDAVQHFYCNRYGHDFEDTGSWANGDSGGEDLTCRRCGYNFRHTYY